MLYDAQNETSDSYVPLSAVGLGALRQAAASGQRVESVIIAARLIENRALHEISQHEAAQIAILLEQAGLTKTAMAFREEVFMAHVMKALFAAKADIS